MHQAEVRLRTRPANSPSHRLRRRVRVTGVRRQRYVEFDYVHGDPDLAVELVMPLAAFDSFCAENLCEISAASPEARAALVRLEQSVRPRSSRFASLVIWETIA